MYAAGLTQERIAYVVGLSKARVGQLLDAADAATQASAQTT